MSGYRVMVQEICTQLCQHRATHASVAEERKETALATGSTRRVRRIETEAHGGTCARLSGF